MSVLSIGQGKVSIVIKTGVTINGFLYENITAIARLLTYQEILRLDSFQTSSDAANLLVEEDVFTLTFDRMLGFPDDMEIDLEQMEAGVVSTISYAIITKSIAHILSTEEHLQRYERENTPIDSMQLIVARYTSTPLPTVVEYPVNVLFSQFALIKATFPGEIVQGEQDDDGDIEL